MTASSTEKTILRRRLRQARRSLPEDERIRRNIQLLQHLIKTPLFRQSQRIGLYFPADGEADLTPLLEHASRGRKRFYLPVLRDFGHNRLWFAPYRPGQEMLLNRYRIPEPVHLGHQRIFPQQLDLLLMPLVGFDAQGNRLGMGGGFYDRSLAFLQLRRYWRKPRLVGTAWECQRVNSLPVEPWDVPLDAIATEAGVQEFNLERAVDRNPFNYSF